MLQKSEYSGWGFGVTPPPSGTIFVTLQQHRLEGKDLASWMLQKKPLLSNCPLGNRWGEKN
jgi:hypothetical protein